MPAFGKRSLDNLATCHPDLLLVANEVIKTVDFTVIQGSRGRKAQEEAFKAGTSKAKFGQSPHNFKSSLALDFMPYPFNGWNDIEGFKKVGKAFVEAGKRLGIPISYGGDWKSFKDFPHVEIANWKTIKGELAE